MATYTVTKYITRPNTSTPWPEIFLGLNGYMNLKSAGKVYAEASFSSDDLVQTVVFVWASEEEYRNNITGSPTRDSLLAVSAPLYFDYMAENNITGRVEEENGTIKVFNSSSRVFEVQ